MNTPTPSHEEITRRAQEIWRERGCPEGRDTEIWLEAERHLSSAVSNSPVVKAGTATDGRPSTDGGANVAAPAAVQTSDRSISAEMVGKNEARKKAARSLKGAGKTR